MSSVQSAGTVIDADEALTEELTSSTEPIRVTAIHLIPLSDTHQGVSADPLELHP